MECTILDKYLKENGCQDADLPHVIQQHLLECKDCQRYSLFISTLMLQNGVQEKAPASLLPEIEKRIFDSVQPRNKKAVVPFRFMVKPSFAGAFLVLITIVSYLYLVDKKIGYVENLAERFKLTQFEDIKSGDMLYAGKNTTADIRLKNNNTLKVHQNTIVTVKGARYLVLSRGEISLQAGEKTVKVETPDGVFLARNTTAKISTEKTSTDTQLKDGLLKTETICQVYNGELILKHRSEDIAVHQGQKAVVDAKGQVISCDPLTANEIASEKGTVAAPSHKLLTAIGSLCDHCIYSSDYTPGKKTDHIELFGKEIDENRYKVRVFWQEKVLKGLVLQPVHKNNVEVL